jgi:hypothetical protein
MCTFYAILMTVLSCIYTDSFSLKNLILPFLSLSHGTWFISCYFYLFLLSPMLNTVVDHCNKKKFVMLLVVFGVLTFYFGFLQRKSINANGYNIMQFMFLYFVGRFISLHTPNIISLKNRITYIAVYLLCSLAIVGFVELVVHLGLNKEWIRIWAYPYNSPLIVIAAVAFFLFFRTLTFQNRLINWSATSVLAVYLIHESIFVGGLLYPFVYQIGQQITGEWLLWIYLLVFAVAIVVGCILIDKVRMWLTNPIENCLNRINWSSYVDKLINGLVNFRTHR